LDTDRSLPFYASDVLADNEQGSVSQSGFAPPFAHRIVSLDAICGYLSNVIGTTIVRALHCEDPNESWARGPPMM